MLLIATVAGWIKAATSLMETVCGPVRRSRVLVSLMNPNPWLYTVTSLAIGADAIAAAAISSIILFLGSSLLGARQYRSGSILCRRQPVRLSCDFCPACAKRLYLHSVDEAVIAEVLARLDR